MMNELSSLSSSSFRDPSGFMFSRDGVLYRQVNKVYAPVYKRLCEENIFSELINKGWLIPHEEVAVSPEHPDIADCVLRPTVVPVITYPYEWSFGQLKDAALLTLNIQSFVFKRGFLLKDASAYNVQFYKGKPVFIDTLSFIEWKDQEPWVAYRQFCQHFLAPLALMSKRDIDLQQLLRIYIDGIPLPLASKLMPTLSRFRFGLFMHLFFHASMIRRYQAHSGKSIKKPRISKIGMSGTFDSLRSTIKKLTWHPEGTEWADYEVTHNYTAEDHSCKKSLVSQFLSSVNPKIVFDLGANTGEFSKIAADCGADVVALDADSGCVHKLYTRIRSDNAHSILPIRIDLSNPSPSQGWNSEERMSFFDRCKADAVLALAIIHHLVYGNHVPLSNVASFFAKLSKHLIIEFVPPADPQVLRLRASRSDAECHEYTESLFVDSFSVYFTIRSFERVGNSGRVLYLMERK